jgi:Raf kinase inhibitor-like YbhB/YbcL family protein
LPDRSPRLALAAVLVFAAAAGVAQAKGELAIDAARPASSVGLKVSSSAIGAGGRIAPRYSAYGANRSPAVKWSPAPGAKAYALVIEDPDAPSPQPFIHWLVWNLPSRSTAIGEGAAPAGAVQGRNGPGGQGYSGPHPPSGTHHYHFEVFALSAPLAVAPGADRAALIRAMSGHVIASGQAVGLFSPPTH